MKWQINDTKTTLKSSVPFEVIIPEHVYVKMMAYIDAVKGEISGMGEVIRVGPHYIVKDVWLLKQECTGASTSIDPISLADLRVELDSQGKAQEGFQLWWHSHADMGTFWSGTDDATINMFMQDIDWMLFIVANKKRALRARLEFRVPLELSIDDLPSFVETVGSIDQETVKAEVELKVKDKTWQGHGFGASVRDWDKVTQRWVDTDTSQVPMISQGDDDFFKGSSRGASVIDLSTPAGRGEHYWMGLSKKSKKAIRRLCGEKEPFCVPQMCRVCKKAGFVFWVKHLKNLICTECILDAVDSTEHGARVDYKLPPMTEDEIKKMGTTETPGTLEGPHGA